MLTQTRDILIALCLVTGAAHADWNGFRGGPALGVSAATELPLRWTKEEGVAWRVEPPGWGDSSPIVVEDRVYLTAQTEDTGLQVMAYQAGSGERIWLKQVAKGKLKSHDFQNMATPTPVADATRVWALFGTGDLVCLDAQGALQWHRDLQKDYGAYKIMWGMATSPVLHQDKIFIACMQSAPSYVLALDAATGREAWKQDRVLGADNEARDSYSTPILVRSGGRDELVVAGAEHINAYDPQTGQQIWISSGLSVSHPYGRTIAGPTAGPELILAVASGFKNQGRVRALRLGETGDITEHAHIWTVDRFAPDCPTPLIYQGLVYMIRDDGMASCLDAKTGEPKWQERVHKGNVKVSPVAGAGRVYFLSGQANCAVVQAGPTFKLLAQNNLDQETLSTPALSQNRIFLRTKEHLYAIGPSGQ